jgi:DNA-binding NarL/FixJ family response regulator
MPLLNAKDPTVRNGILIVADQALSAEAIRRELLSAAGYTVIGRIDGCRPCASVVAKAAPKVIVFDEMRDHDRALRRIRECRDAAPAAKLVLVTLSLERSWLASAAQAGIDAAIAKRIRPGSLGTFLCEVVNGNVFHAFAPAPDRHANNAAAGLTTRETEILRLVAAGASNARIAQELWVTPQTVKFHLSNVFRKLGVANRTEASHYAHVHRIIEVEAQSEPAPAPRAA